MTIQVGFGGETLAATGAWMCYWRTVLQAAKDCRRLLRRLTSFSCVSSEMLGVRKRRRCRTRWSASKFGIYWHWTWSDDKSTHLLEGARTIELCVALWTGIDFGTRRTLVLNASFGLPTYRAWSRWLALVFSRLWFRSMRCLWRHRSWRVFLVVHAKLERRRKGRKKTGFEVDCLY